MTGLGKVIWKAAVALYLLATGVLGVSQKGDLAGILTDMFGKNIGWLIIAAGVIALIAGVLLILEMCNVKIPAMEILLLIVAIIWIVFAVFMFIKKIGNQEIWYTLQELGKYIMVSASLLVASKKFD